MSRNYLPIPPFTQSVVALSDETPSGLAWVKENRFHKAGDPVTRRLGKTKFYSVAIGNNVYLAHRVVYYLRTGEDPRNGDVMHGPNNPDCDNRLPLTISSAYVSKNKKRRLSVEALRDVLNTVEQYEMDEFLGQLVLLGGAACNSTMLSKLLWDEEKYERVKSALVARFYISLRRGPGGAISLLPAHSELLTQVEFLRSIGNKFFLNQ